MTIDPTTAFIEAALRQRLGPTATLGKLSFEGALLRVEGATVPLHGEGMEATLAIAEAVIAMGSGAAIERLPIKARLVSLRGELSATILAGALAATASVELASSEEAAQAESWARGTLSVLDLDLGAGAPTLAASVSIDVEPGGFRLWNGKLEGAGTAATFGARGDAMSLRLDHAVATASALAPSLVARVLAAFGKEAPALPKLAAIVDEPGTLAGGAVSWTRKADGAGPSFTATLARSGARLVLRGEPGAGVSYSFEGVPPSIARPLLAAFVEPSLARQLAMPGDLALGGEVRLDDAGAWSGTARLATARSLVTTTIAVSPEGNLEGSRVSGRVGLADVLALVDLRGAPALPRPEHEVSLDLAVAGTTRDPRAHGAAFAEALELAQGTSTALRVEAVHVAFDADRQALRYREGRATASGAALRFSGEVRLGPPPSRLEGTPLFRLHVDRAKARLVAGALAIAGVPALFPRSGAPPAGSFWLPEDLSVSGEIVVRAGPALSGALAIATARSQVDLAFSRARDGSLAGSTVRGRVSTSDVLATGLLPSPSPLARGSDVSLDARLGGKDASPTITGRASSKRLALVVEGGLTLPFDDVSLRFEASSKLVRWNDLRARFASGTIDSSGALGPDASGADLRATVVFAGVRVADLAIGPPSDDKKTKAPRLGEYLEGVASGHVGVKRTGASGPLRARGEVKIKDPVYPFVRGFAGQLARYGLPPLDPRGTRPLEAKLHLRDGVLHVESARGAIEAAEVEGQGALKLDATRGLSGELAIHLLERYLRRSVTLALPSLLAERVSIPITVSGTLAEPELSTDPLAALEGFLAKNRVGDAMKRTFKGLRDAFEGPKPKAR